jgi:hypothetical protein
MQQRTAARADLASALALLQVGGGANSGRLMRVANSAFWRQRVEGLLQLADAATAGSDAGRSGAGRGGAGRGGTGRE